MENIRRKPWRNIVAAASIWCQPALAQWRLASYNH
jgi:hypothetical protein